MGGIHTPPYYASLYPRVHHQPLMSDTGYTSPAAVQRDEALGSTL